MGALTSYGTYEDAESAFKQSKAFKSLPTDADKQHAFIILRQKYNNAHIVKGLLNPPAGESEPVTGTPNPGKPVEQTPLSQAFAGDTFRLQMLRSSPNPGHAVAAYLQAKGYKPVEDKGVTNGEPLWQRGDTVVNAAEIMPGAYAKATGIPMLAGGAAQLGTEMLTKSPVLGGAAGNVASDLTDRIMAKMTGAPRDKLTASGIATDAGVGAVAGAIPKLAGKITGLGGAKEAATEGFNTAVTEGRGIAAEKAGVFPALKQQFKGKVQEGLEAGRQPAAQQQSERIMDRMLNKSPGQAAAERAEPEDVVAPRVAQAKRTYFDALKDVRTQRQAPYEKALEPVTNKPVTTEEVQGLQKVVGDIRATPGLNIRSTELKKAFDRIEEPSGGFTAAERGTLAKSMTNDQIAKLEAKAEMSGGSSEPLTYGEIWRLRNDANRIISTSTDPEEHTAAHQFSDRVDDIIDKVAPVAQSDKDRYALYKSGFSPSLTRNIAKARTPGEVGKAIFTQPETVTTQVIDSVKKSPAALERLQGSFADYVREEGLPADKVVKQTNPTVMRKLYGDASEPLIKLAGPDMNVKAASWARMIQSSPEGRQAFNKTIADTMEGEGMKEAQAALREGTQAVGILPKEQQVAVNAAVAKAKTIPQKLAILEKALPDPKEAAVKELQKGPGYNHWQRWALHHGAFMALGAAAGGSGFMSGNKPLEVAGLSMFMLPYATQTLLKNPTLARGFVNMLDMAPSRFSLTKAGTTVGRILATQAIAQAGDAVVDAGTAQPEPVTPAPITPNRRTIGR